MKNVIFILESMSRLKKARRIVAREAAFILYKGEEKEYLQAKRRAAQNLGLKVLPTNLEVAEELDRVADEMEETDRQSRLIEMRKEALKIMELLGDFHPRLIGSVWRGTARRNSDIDINIYHPEPLKALKTIVERGIKETKIEWKTVKNGKKTKTVPHIYTKSPSGYTIELMVRDLEELEKPGVCEIYGDRITGLNEERLKEVLEKEPLKKFVPHRKLHGV